MGQLLRGLLVVILCTLGTSASRAATLETFTVEGWGVGAYSNNATRQFSHCATLVPYVSGEYLLFSVGKKFTWSMGFANDNWNLTPGREVNFAYSIDMGPRLPARGIVLSKTMIEVPLVDSRSLFDSFRRGYQLLIHFGDRTFTFNLNNSSKALDATLECTRRYTAGTQQGRPSVAQGSQQTLPSTGDAQNKAEAAILVANVLSAAGITGFQILPLDQTPPELKGFDALWGAEGGLVGAVRIIGPKSAQSAQELASYVMAADAQRCKGTFASGRYPTPPQSNSARLKTACSGTMDKPSSVDYTITPRPRGGGYYLLSVIAPEDQAQAAQDAGVRLHEATIRSFSQRQ